MLELPEVITLSKQVNNALSGKTITQVFNATKPHKFTFYNGNPSEYGKLLVGKTILSSEGYGMFVNFNLSDNVIMNIGDGVSVRYYNAGDKIPANYQLLLTFNDDSFLVFTVVMYGFINVYPDSYIDNKYYKGEFYQFNLSSCIRQQNSLTAQFVSFSLANLANIFLTSAHWMLISAAWMNCLPMA